eukprot:m.123410 g.123410  ORF g.123410 m.123410 type:complete len:202 (-) comp28985_c0_seq1:73-678(-)
MTPNFTQLTLVVVAFLCPQAQTQGTLHVDHVKILQKVKQKIDRKEKLRAIVPPGSGEGLGWGDHLNWHTLEDARSLVISGEVCKPILLLIHTPNCDICGDLSLEFKSSRAIKKLSESFIMVNVEDEEDSGEHSDTYKHGYPRLMFLDSEGKVRPEIRNPKSKYAKHNYPYFYGSITHMVEGMRSALHQLPHGGKPLVHNDL